MISFKTYDFGTYALLNDRHAHMPFQSWRMRPKSVNHLLFTLNTQSFEIIFEIRVSSLHTGFIFVYKILSLFLQKKTEKENKIEKSTRTHGNTEKRIELRFSFCI
jgi:hypothetical protein